MKWPLLPDRVDADPTLVFVPDHSTKDECSLHSKLAGSSGVCARSADSFSTLEPGPPTFMHEFYLAGLPGKAGNLGEDEDPAEQA